MGSHMSDERIKMMINKMNTDPKIQGLLLRRTINGYPDIQSANFNLQNVQAVCEYLGDVPERWVDDDEDFAVMEVPRELLYQALDMLQAYAMMLMK